MNRLIKAAIIVGGIKILTDFAFALGKGTGLQALRLQNPEIWPELKKASEKIIKDSSPYDRAFIKVAMFTAEMD